jgi:hypothetical protein
MRPIETGAGVSTIAFALKRVQHTCVVWDRRVVRRIRQYCASAAALPTSAAFRKERNDAQHAEWVDQPFVYWQSPAARLSRTHSPEAVR